MFSPKFREVMLAVGPDGLTGYQRRARKCIENKLAKDPDAMKKHGQQMLKTMGPDGIRKRAEAQSATKTTSESLTRRERMTKYRNRVAYLSRKNDLSDLPNFEKWGSEYHLDHKLSIRDGFDAGLAPEILAHKSNLQFLHRADNRAKWHSSSMTVQELLESIKC
jgi:hypothetical protein